MMDGPSSSTNPPHFEQDDNSNTFVTKEQLFGAQRALHQEKQTSGDRINSLATDMWQSMASLKDDIRAMMVNRSSTTSSYSRRSRSSRHSSDNLSTPTSNTLRQAACQDGQANRNPLHDD